MLQKLIYILAVPLILSGCQSIKPSLTDCSTSLTAIEEGSRVTLRTLENGSLAEARLNGVTALCNVKETETIVKSKVGLKLTRAGSDLETAVLLELPILIAILDQEDTVVGYESLSYQMSFPSNQAIIYPVINPKITIPKYGRAIISLSPTILRP